jgi:hypothetical protein
MSSWVRQGLLLQLVQCRVEFDKAFCCSRSNVELSSTRLSVVPRPVSSCACQGFPLYQVQCRVEFNEAFCCTWSNRELSSTRLSVLPGPMSSWARQGFPLYQVQCRADLVKAFSCTKSNVELSSTRLAVTRSYVHVILQCFMFLSLSSCNLIGRFRNLKTRYFSEKSKRTRLLQFRRNIVKILKRLDISGCSVPKRV